MKIDVVKIEVRGADGRELVWLSNLRPKGKQIALENLLINFRVSLCLPHPVSQVLSGHEGDL